MCQLVSRTKKFQKSKCEVKLALLKIKKPFGMFRRVKINKELPTFQIGRAHV
jgi:hypothetical protein